VTGVVALGARAWIGFARREQRDLPRGHERAPLVFGVIALLSVLSRFTGTLSGSGDRYYDGYEPESNGRGFAAVLIPVVPGQSNYGEEAGTDMTKVSTKKES
jgi:hypothetical protein